MKRDKSILQFQITTSRSLSQQFRPNFIQNPGKIVVSAKLVIPSNALLFIASIRIKLTCLQEKVHRSNLLGNNMFIWGKNTCSSNQKQTCHMTYQTVYPPKKMSRSNETINHVTISIHHIAQSPCPKPRTNYETGNPVSISPCMSYSQSHYASIIFTLATFVIPPVFGVPHSRQHQMGVLSAAIPSG